MKGFDFFQLRSIWTEAGVPIHTLVLSVAVLSFLHSFVPASKLLNDGKMEANTMRLNKIQRASYCIDSGRCKICIYANRYK